MITVCAATYMYIIYINEIYDSNTTVAYYIIYVYM